MGRSEERVVAVIMVGGPTKGIHFLFLFIFLLNRLNFSFAQCLMLVGFFSLWNKCWMFCMHLGCSS